MRKKVKNSEFKGLMAEYGITTLDIAKELRTARSYVSVLLNKDMNKRQKEKIRWAIDELIYEGEE